MSPFVSNLKARNSKILRCNTVDDTKKASNFSKIEGLNVTPASGIKRTQKMQYTDTIKRRLANTIEKSAFKYKNVSGNKSKPNLYEKSYMKSLLENNAIIKSKK